jgi:hypothetical protein
MKFTGLDQYINPEKETETHKEIVKIKDVVQEVLKESEKARNSDKQLIWECFKKITHTEIDFELFKLMPSFETITRCRRKLNEEGLYLPDDKIEQGRYENEQEFRAWSKE